MSNVERKISRRNFLEGVAAASGASILTWLGALKVTEDHAKMTGPEKFWQEMAALPKNDLSRLLDKVIALEPFHNPTTIHPIALSAGVIDYPYLNLTRQPRKPDGEYNLFSGLPLSKQQAAQYEGLWTDKQLQFIEPVNLEQALLLLNQELNEYSPQLLNNEVGIMVEADQYDVEDFFSADAKLAEQRISTQTALATFVLADLQAMRQKLQELPAAKNLTTDEITQMQRSIEDFIIDASTNANTLIMKLSASLRLGPSPNVLAIMDQSELMIESLTEPVSLPLHSMKLMPYMPGFRKYKLLNPNKISQLVWGYEFAENLGLAPDAPEALAAISAVSELENGLIKKLKKIKLNTIAV